jgi:hypothetical protein
MTAKNNEVAVTTTQENGIAQLGSIGGTVDLKEEKAIAKMENAKVIPIKTNIDSWSPEKPNESLEGVFQGLSTIKMPSLNDENVIEDVPVAVFAVLEDVPNKDGEAVAKQIAFKGIAAKRCVSHFRNGLMKDQNGQQATPVNTMWKIVFKGKQKNKTNSKQSSVFDMYRMDVNGDVEPKMQEAS